MINVSFTHRMSSGILAPEQRVRCKSNAFMGNATNTSVLVIKHFRTGRQF